MFDLNKILPPAAAALCLLIATLPQAEAGSAKFNNFGGTYAVPVKSFAELRFGEVIRQRYDFSCGSAALATLLTYHYGRPTTEEDTFRVMWEHGDREQIREQGFSLLDMQNYLGQVGLQADGFRVDVDKLIEVGVPGIVLIDSRGYKHFVVVKGIRDNLVLLGDPARGMKMVPRDAFEAKWNGIVFAIRDEMDEARLTFDRDDDWRLQPSAPLGMALDRSSLGALTTMLPGPNDY